MNSLRKDHFNCSAKAVATTVFHGSKMAWFTKLARTSLPLGCSRTLTSSTKTTAAQLKILREERESAAAPSQTTTDGELNCDGPYSAPQMKTTMPGPKSRVSVYLMAYSKQTNNYVKIIELCTLLQCISRYIYFT